MKLRALLCATAGLLPAAAHAFPNPIADRGTTEIWIDTPGATGSRLVALVDVCQVSAGSELERWVVFEEPKDADGNWTNDLYGSWTEAGLLPRDRKVGDVFMRAAPYQSVWYHLDMGTLKRNDQVACRSGAVGDAFVQQWQAVVEKYYGDGCSASDPLCNPSSPQDCSDVAGDACRGSIAALDRSKVVFWSGCHADWQPLDQANPVEIYHTGSQPPFVFGKRVDHITCDANANYDAIVYGELHDAGHTPFRAHQVRKTGQTCSGNAPYAHHTDNGTKNLSQLLSGLTASQWEYSWGVAQDAHVMFPDMPGACL